MGFFRYWYLLTSFKGYTQRVRTFLKVKLNKRENFFLSRLFIWWQNYRELLIKTIKDKLIIESVAIMIKFIIQMQNLWKLYVYTSLITISSLNTFNIQNIEEIVQIDIAFFICNILVNLFSKALYNQVNESFVLSSVLQKRFTPHFATLPGIFPYIWIVNNSKWMWYSFCARFTFYANETDNRIYTTSFKAKSHRVSFFPYWHLEVKVSHMWSLKVICEKILIYSS